MEYETVAEFRKNIKIAFDKARTGRTVYIKRGKERFLLVSKDAVLKAKEPAEDQFAQEYPSEKLEKNPTDSKTSDVMPEVYSHRSKGAILSDIKAVEAERDDLLANCQDRETSRDIEKQFKAKLDDLWEEYNSITSA